MELEQELPFEDEKFMSAAEKRLVLSAWKTFLKHGCQKDHFTERLYDHLMQHCSFIAHFSRHGFYAFYFETPSQSTYRFLDQFDPVKPGISAEYGNTFWLSRSTGCDLSEAMREAAAPYIPKLRFQFASLEQQQDLSIAVALAAKHGKQLVDADVSGTGAQPTHSDTQWANPTTPAISEGAEEQLSMFASCDAAQ
jgi:hypothetical protein